MIAHDTNWKKKCNKAHGAADCRSMRARWKVFTFRVDADKSTTKYERRSCSNSQDGGVGETTSASGVADMFTCNGTSYKQFGDCFKYIDDFLSGLKQAPAESAWDDF